MVVFNDLGAGKAENNTPNYARNSRDLDGF
jgi:hypothetical protein